MLTPARRRTLIVSAALFFSGAHAPNVGTAGQLQERAVKKVAWRKEPVKSVKLKVKGNPVEVGKKFLGEDDWLKGFSVSLKNTSDKTIVWLDIALNFPRAETPSAEPDARDAIYPSLRLWRDANHDGRSQPAELFTLAALDVTRLHLGYKESKRVDEHGNRFLYRAKLDDARGAKAGRWAWDVFLTRGQ